MRQRIVYQRKQRNASLREEIGTVVNNTQRNALAPCGGWGSTTDRAYISTGCRFRVCVVAGGESVTLSHFKSTCAVRAGNAIRPGLLGFDFVCRFRGTSIRARPIAGWASRCSYCFRECSSRQGLVLGRTRKLSL